MQRCKSIFDKPTSSDELGRAYARTYKGFSSDRMNHTMPVCIDHLNDLMDGSMEELSQTMDMDSTMVEQSLTDDLATLRMNDEELEKHQEEKRRQATYKTSMCRAVKNAEQCPYGEKCTFAHDISELRQTEARGKRHPKYKTQLCSKFSQTGFCRYGDRCMYIHHLKNQKVIDHRKNMGIPLGANRRPEMIDSMAVNQQSNPRPLMSRILPAEPPFYEEHREQTHVLRYTPPWASNVESRHNMSLPLSYPQYQSENSVRQSNMHPTNNRSTRQPLFSRNHNRFDSGM
ncbi:unnamed protein product, partial [Mesorhabditis belari]|uniref:C3H1-type domain-containing protein n=1 Tax=Mesorhabditis belari TaxID=2138241 RepID=A0AAF3ERW1_9BILA